MTKNTYPPGPKVSRLEGLLLATRRRDPLAFLLKTAREYGDIAHFRVGSRRIFLLSHPDYVRDTTHDYYQSFSKTRRGDGRRSQHFLGEGLIISEGDLHRRQRRLIAPAFHRQQIADSCRVMVARAARRQDGWRNGAQLDIVREMRHLTLEIIGELLFGIEFGEEAEEISRLVAFILTQFAPFGVPFVGLLSRLPLPRVRRVEAARTRLDAILKCIIADHDAAGTDGGNVLSMLLDARDEQGERMSAGQVRDELMTLFLAGHESLSNALVWTWYLVSQHPQVESKLHAELDALGCAPPTFADLPRLRYAEMVFAESMRLYPPAWILARYVAKDYSVGGYVMPAGSVVACSQYVIHRDPRYFNEPERFDPERWTPEAKAARPQFSYFPFGGGPRRCIGEALSWAEGVLLIATIAQRWRLRLVGDRPVETEPVVTLRPKHAMLMTLEQRERASVEEFEAQERALCATA